MDHELMNLFAVPVYKSSLGRKYEQVETDYFRKELRDPVPTIYNHFSRNNNILDVDAMKNIRTFIQQNLDNYFSTVYNTSNKVTLEITQSWLSVTGRGEAHHTHAHPNSFASGVLYINLAKKDGINFYRNEESKTFELLPKEENYYNAYTYSVEAQIGDILIFPSTLKHGVNEVTDDIERVSLSFNTFLSGELGRDSFYNGLRIKVN